MTSNPPPSRTNVASIVGAAAIEAGCTDDDDGSGPAKAFTREQRSAATTVDVYRPRAFECLERTLSVNAVLLSRSR